MSEFIGFISAIFVAHIFSSSLLSFVPLGQIQPSERAARVLVSGILLYSLAFFFSSLSYYN